MKTVLLGRKTGLRVSNLCFGTGLLGKALGYGTDDAEVQNMLKIYVDAGGNFFDTSDAYQFGQAEASLGEFIGARRDDVVIASKYCRTAARAPGAAAKGSHRKSMVQSVEASLKRLKTDRIDLYFVHFDDGVTPIEEIARGFDDLVRSGKIIYGGFSNTPAWRIAKAATIAELRGWAPITTTQIEYSLVERTAERDLLPLADEFGLGVMAYSALATGILTGKYRRGEQGRAMALPGTVRHDDSGRNAAILNGVIEVAQQLGATAGQVALAWVMRRGAIPIIGPRTSEQLRDNIGALNLSLTSDQVQQLDGLSAVPGGYPHDVLARMRA
jgi:aryl-alcohol dehydrogenase-like predicted oxidoreductase